MRELESHKVNPGNNELQIKVIDQPGQGGACHDYEICYHGMSMVTLQFQNGPINAEGGGVNGVTHEALLAILEDRLAGFQSGAYACFENEQALQHVRQAQTYLHQRTRARMDRDVAGTHEV